MKIYPITNSNCFKAKDKKPCQRPSFETKNENQFSKNDIAEIGIVYPVFVHKQTNGFKRRIETAVRSAKQLFLQNKIDETAEFLADFYIENGGLKGIAKIINKAGIRPHKKNTDSISAKIENSCLYVGKKDIGLIFDDNNTQKKIKVTIENNKLKSYEAYNHKADGYNCSYSISYNY